VELCQAAMPTYFIRNAEEILSLQRIRHFLLHLRHMTTTEGWLPDKRPLDVALTCGASCPDAIVDGVLFRVLSFFSATRPLERRVAALSGGAVSHTPGTGSTPRIHASMWGCLTTPPWLYTLLAHRS